MSLRGGLGKETIGACPRNRAFCRAEAYSCGYSSASAYSASPERPPTSGSSASGDTLPHAVSRWGAGETAIGTTYTRYSTPPQDNAPFREYNPLKRPRPDEDASYVSYDTRLAHHTPPPPKRVRTSASPAPSEDSMVSDSSSSRCPEVVSLHGGCVVSSKNPVDVGDAQSIIAYNTLRPPPTRLASMASMTSFTLDSARAMDTIHDLAAQRQSLARPRATPSSSLSAGQSPASAFGAPPAIAEKASRLSSGHSVESSASLGMQQSSPSGSERHRSVTPPEASVAPTIPVFDIPTMSPTATTWTFQVPPPEFPPPEVPPPQIPPLTYVVTTPAHVLATLPSPYAPPNASMFNMDSYEDLGQGQHRIKFKPCKRWLADTARRKDTDEPPMTMLRFTPPPPPPPRKPKPAPPPKVKTEASDAQLSDPLADDRPPKESVAQIAVGAGVKYHLTKIKCLWPDCSAHEFAGELWHHIKDVHRKNAGRPKPSGNPILLCSWAPPGEPRDNRCTHRDRASRMWDHFIAMHQKESVCKETGEIVCRVGQCAARSKNLDFQRHLEDVHWKLEGTVRWCEGCGVWKRFDKGRLLKHFETCVRKYMENDPGFRQGLEEL
ncbi:uncharacterized protein C8Q71DRAFT_768622 [Rhodofomes roseus]|uniref:C2H2-type domain-containing protein n=1 Tax=Rhodofomes roseus TaxID=34475 RepID=A0ABQ8KBQ7_9APHY|nr:uncharacterized protein C8Q71DRAFT_768622 [Rhodofomes roseus]KAH9834416.1 hypothetical protein C8Q71DRAFT_768622 [Rhodofomes roseus]